MRMPKHDIEAYAETAGQRRKQISGYSGTQKGDPVRAAEAIVEAVESAEPPLHLLLGKLALDLVRAKLAAMGREFDAWESVTLGADFPE